MTRALTKPLISIIFHVSALSDEETPKTRGKFTFPLVQHLRITPKQRNLYICPESQILSTVWKRQGCEHSVSARYPLAQDSNCIAALICEGHQRNKSHYLNSYQSQRHYRQRDRYSNASARNLLLLRYAPGKWVSHLQLAWKYGQTCLKKKSIFLSRLIRKLVFSVQDKAMIQKPWIKWLTTRDKLGMIFPSSAMPKNFLA